MQSVLIFRMGSVDAGLFLKLKGDGNEWNNPMFSQDYPVFPFIPSSWGGVNQTSGQFGCSIINGTVTTTSGPRILLTGMIYNNKYISIYLFIYIIII